MTRSCFTLLLTLTCATGSRAQHSSETTLPKTIKQPAVMVYTMEDGLTAPKLISFPAASPTEGKCKGRTTAKTSFTLVVDSHGLPRNIMFAHPSGTPLDLLALRTVIADRFTPGTRGAVPVAVARTDEVTVEVCTSNGKDQNGRKVTVLTLRSNPTQLWSPSTFPSGEVVLAPVDDPMHPEGEKPARIAYLGSDVTDPVPIWKPQADYTIAAEENDVHGVCVVALIVDEHGLPRDAHLIGSLEPSLDRSALRAVERYRFTPAMRDGEPVAVAFQVEVRFD